MIAALKAHLPLAELPVHTLDTRHDDLEPKDAFVAFHSALS